MSTFNFRGQAVSLCPFIKYTLSHNFDVKVDFIIDGEADFMKEVNVIVVCVTFNSGPVGQLFMATKFEELATNPLNVVKCMETQIKAHWMRSLEAKDE